MSKQGAMTQKDTVRDDGWRGEPEAWYTVKTIGIDEENDLRKFRARSGPLQHKRRESGTGCFLKQPNGSW